MTTSIFLQIGSFDPEQSRQLSQSGLVMQTCSGAYDAAGRIRDLGDSLRGICISPGALSPAVVNLIALVREKFPRITLYLAPNSTGKRAELAEKLGLFRWENPAAPSTSPPAPAAKIPDVPVDDEAPPAPKQSFAEAVRARQDSSTPNIVRMAPRPRNGPPAKSVASDNANLAAEKPLPVEADIAARYDAETGDQILTDDELRALLDDSADSREPNDPRRS
jgi:hypothetical protein